MSDIFRRPQQFQMGMPQQTGNQPTTGFQQAQAQQQRSIQDLLGRLNPNPIPNEYSADFLDTFLQGQENPEQAVHKLYNSAYIARQLNEDPGNVFANYDLYSEKLFGNTGDPVSNWRRLGQFYESGQLGVELNRLYYDLRDDPENTELLQKIEQLTNSMPQIDDKEIGRLLGILPFSWVEKAMNTLPNIIESYLAGARMAAPAAVAALPAAVVASKVPFAGQAAGLGILGMAIQAGWTTGSFYELQRSLTGSSYQQMREAGVDHDIAHWASGVAGVLASGANQINPFDFLPVQQIGATRFLGEALQQSIVKIVGEGTFKSVVSGVVSRYASDVSMNVAQEILQDLSVIVMHNVAGMVQNSDEHRELAELISSQGAIDKLYETMVDTFQASAVLGLPRAGSDFAQSSFQHATNRTMINRSALNRNSNTLVDSTLVERMINPNPQQTQEFQARQQNEETRSQFSDPDGTLQTLYVSERSVDGIITAYQEGSEAAGRAEILQSEVSQTQAMNTIRQNQPGWMTDFLTLVDSPLMQQTEQFDSKFQELSVVYQQQMQQANITVDMMQDLVNALQKLDTLEILTNPEIDMLSMMGIEMKSPDFIAVNIDAQNVQQFASFDDFKNSDQEVGILPNGNVLVKNADKIFPTGIQQLKRNRIPKQNGNILTQEDDSKFMALDPKTNKPVATLEYTKGEGTTTFTTLPDNPTMAAEIIGSYIAKHPGERVRFAVMPDDMATILRQNPEKKVALREQAKLDKQIQKLMDQAEDARAAKDQAKLSELLSQVNELEGKFNQLNEQMGNLDMEYLGITDSPQFTDPKVIRDNIQKKMDIQKLTYEKLNSQLQELFPQYEKNVIEASMALVDLRAEAMQLTREQWVERYLIAPVKGELSDGLNQTYKGAVDFLEDGRALIVLGPNSDISTWIHEFGHVLRRQLNENQLQRLEQWAGVKNGQWILPITEQNGKYVVDGKTFSDMASAVDFANAAEEKFARTWEAYILEGKMNAPQELKGVFETLRYYMARVYSSVRDLFVTPDAQAYAVFDELLGLGTKHNPNPDGSITNRPLENLPIFQKVDPRDPDNIVIHALNADNLESIQKIGGMPSPSIAITKSEYATSNAGFGDITLIADKTMLDNVELFDRDVYSPTVPSPIHKVDKKKSLELFKKLDPISREIKNDTDSSAGYISDWDYHIYDTQNNKKRFLSWLEYNETAMVHYLRTKDPNFQIPRSEPQELRKYSDVLINLDTDNVQKILKFDQYKDVRNAIADQIQMEIDLRDFSKTPYRQKIRDQYQELIDLLKQGPPEGDSYQEYSRKLHSYVNGFIAELKQARNSGKELNRDALTQIIDSQRGEYKNFIEEEFGGIFNNPYVQIGKSKEYYSLDNIVRAIEAQKTVGSEKTLVFGSGNAQSFGAKRLDGVDDVKANNYRLKSSEEVKAYHEERISPLVDALHRQAEQNYNYKDIFESYSDSLKAVAQYLKKDYKKPNIEAAKKALSKNDFKPSDGMAEIVIALAEAMRDAPVKYFEGKAYGAMQISDFKAAVVPKGTNQKAIDYLKSKGLEIRDYNTVSERSEAVQSLAKDQGLLFQQSPTKDSPEFKAWFKESKVVDENGDPLVVFHGTDSVFESFSKDLRGSNYQDLASKIGFFFTVDEDDASYFGKNVGAYYLSIDSLMVIDDNVISEYTSEWLSELEYSDPKEYEFQINTKQYENSDNINKGLELAIVDAKNRRFSGVKVSVEGGADWYVAFEPTQAKSIFNNGQWSQDDPRLMYQKAWHGSPHKHDRFSTDYIGTGEGAQAFGWGLYFTENEMIARDYADKLQSNNKRSPDFTGNGTYGMFEVFFRERVYHTNDIEGSYSLVMDNAQDKIQEAEILSKLTKSEWLEKNPLYKNNPFVDDKYNSEIERYNKLYQELLNSYNKVKQEYQQIGNEVIEQAKDTGRNLYEVDIPDEGYIQWDSPITEEQSQVITNLIENSADPEFVNQFNLDRGSDSIISNVNNILRTLDDETMSKIGLEPGTLFRKSNIDELSEFISYVSEIADDAEAIDPNLANSLRQATQEFDKSGLSDMTGQEVYELLSDALGSDMDASLALLDAGIPGIKYPAQFLSGGDGSKGFNYVVFDDNAIKIENHLQFSKDPREIQKQQIQEAIQRGEDVPMETLQEFSDEQWAMDEIEYRRAMFPDWEQEAVNVLSDDVYSDSIDMDQEYSHESLMHEYETSSELARELFYDGNSLDRYVQDFEEFTGKLPTREELNNATLEAHATLGGLEALRKVIKRLQGQGESFSGIGFGGKFWQFVNSAVDSPNRQTYLTHALNEAKANPNDFRKAVHEAMAKGGEQADYYAMMVDRLVDKYQPLTEADPEFKRHIDKAEDDRRKRLTVADLYDEIQERIKIIRGDIKDSEIKKSLKDVNKAIQDAQSRHDATLQTAQELERQLNQIIQRNREVDRAVEKRMKEDSQEIRDLTRERDHLQERKEHFKNRLYTEKEQLRQINKELKAQFRELNKAKRLEAYQKNLIGQLKTLSKRKNIDFEYKVAIQHIVDQFDWTMMNKKQRETFNKAEQQILAWMDSEPENFDAETYRDLSRKYIQDVSISDLEAMKRVIKDLIIQGKQVYEQKQADKLKRKETLISKIQDSQLEQIAKTAKKPMDVALQELMDRPRGDSRENGIDLVKGAYLETITPQFLFDILDGGKDFKGPFNEIFYQRALDAANERQRFVQKRTDQAKERMQQLGITESDLESSLISIRGMELTVQEGIGVYVKSQNQKATQALLLGNKLTQAEINQIIGSLERKYLELGEFIISHYEENLNRLRQTFIELNNVDLGLEENYTPIQRLSSVGLELDAQMKEDLLGRSALNKPKAADGFTQNRVQIPKEWQTPIRLDEWKMLIEMIDKQEHYIHTAELIGELNSILRDSTLQQMIAENHGKRSLKVIENWLQRAAQPSRMTVFDNVDRFANRIGKNISYAYLAYNMLTPLKQIPSLLYYMSETDPGTMTKQLSRIMTPQGRAEMQSLMFEYAPIMKDRLIEGYLNELRNSSKGKFDQIIDKIGKPGMYLIQKMDALAVTTGWNSVFQTQIRDGKTAKEAAKVATELTLRTQPVGDPMFMSQIMTKKGFTGLITKFGGQLNQIWSNMTHLPEAAKAQVLNKYAATMVSVLFGGILMTALKWKRPPETPEEWLEFSLESMASQTVGSFPVMGSITMQALAGFDADLPIAAPVTRTVAMARELGKDDPNLTRAAMLAWESIAISTGLPYTGGKRIIDGLIKADQEPPRDSEELFNLFFEMIAGPGRK
jgi:hypothetical protein